jgi:hypothetical protein
MRYFGNAAIRHVCSFIKCLVYIVIIFPNGWVPIILLFEMISDGGCGTVYMFLFFCTPLGCHGVSNGSTFPTLCELFYLAPWSARRFSLVSDFLSCLILPYTRTIFIISRTMDAAFAIYFLSLFEWTTPCVKNEMNDMRDRIVITWQVLLVGQKETTKRTICICKG